MERMYALFQRISHGIIATICCFHGRTKIIEFLFASVQNNLHWILPQPGTEFATSCTLLIYIYYSLCTLYRIIRAISVFHGNVQCVHLMLYEHQISLFGISFIYSYSIQFRTSWLHIFPKDRKQAYSDTCTIVAILV